MKTAICLVTGANRGIGKATATGLVERGAHVILVSRGANRGASVVDALNEKGPGSAELMTADLSILDDVRRLGTQVMERHQRLDVLINNAGTAAYRRYTTVDGHELVFAVNHLAPFLLTLLLLPLLGATDGARVITVSSNAHRRIDLKLDNLQLERGYGAYRAYSQSKLANVLFTRELARLLAREGSHITANALHPGVIATGLLGKMFGLPRFLSGILRLMYKSPQAGAATSLFLATDPSVAQTTGKYFKDCREVEAAAAVGDEQLARGLWQESERLVGLRFADAFEGSGALREKQRHGNR